MLHYNYFNLAKRGCTILNNKFQPFYNAIANFLLRIYSSIIIENIFEEGEGSRDVVRDRLKLHDKGK